MVTALIHEAAAKSRREEFREVSLGIKRAVEHRTMWVVAGFIFFWTFSPSIGIPLFYYQTDTLKFSQQFIGVLGSLTAGASIVGAAFYAPLSRRVSLHRLIVLSIAVSTVGTLAYLFYNDRTSAIAIDTVFGGVGMITQLAFLDLAAKACPQARGGHVLRAPDVGLQPGRAGLAGLRRLSVRVDELQHPRLDLSRDDGGSVLPAAAARHPRDRAPRQRRWTAA